MKIQSNTYDAEMARTGGGMFNTLMKSGTNEFHGSLYGHVRRTDWDANNFFSNEAGIPIAEQPNTTWGASFGGKVWIPTFTTARIRPSSFSASSITTTARRTLQFNLPTLAERGGNFSGVVTSAGADRW